MPDTASTLSELMGACLIIFGLSLAWTPLGYIAAGCLLIAGGYLAGDGS